ncbi:MAG: leucine-rich repeat domain-containing protein, partial [Bacillota bacterium]
VESIETSAFQNCVNLETVNILRPSSSGITSLGINAFNGTDLLAILVPDLASQMAYIAANNWSDYSAKIFEYDTTLGLDYTLINGDTAYSVGEGTTTSENIKIPEVYNGLPVTEIGNYAFSNTNINCINIPNSITSIGNNAFSGCTNLLITWNYNSLYTAEDLYLTNYLKSVNFDNVTEIAANAFEHCTGITDITISNNVTSIGSNAFKGCTGLTNIAIPNSVTWIEDNVFEGCTGITDITIPDSVIYIGNYALMDCTGLTHITIPNSVLNMGDYLLFGCDNVSLTWHYTQSTVAYDLSIQNYLTSVNFEGVTSIGNNAFSHCTKLTEISIPDSVTSIGHSAFSYCTELSYVSMENSIISIGYNAFSNCTSLTDITISNSVTNIESAVFRNCEGLTDIILPDGIISIEPYTFENCTGLTNIIIPDSLTNIWNFAFYGCTTLNKIIIPNSVTFIGNNAFQGCSNLTIYAQATNKPSGWETDWNSSNCPVYWKEHGYNSFLMSGFGYTTGTTYYWNGRVEMSANSSYCYRSSNVYAFIGDTNITFNVRTSSYNNYISKITGSLDFELKNSSGNVLQTHNSYVSVSAFNNVSISNGGFTINTANLDNGTYTLTLSSSFTRLWWSDSHTRTFTFVVDK